MALWRLPVGSTQRFLHPLTPSSPPILLDATVPFWIVNGKLGGPGTAQGYPRTAAVFCCPVGLPLVLGGRFEHVFLSGFAHQVGFEGQILAFEGNSYVGSGQARCWADKQLWAFSEVEAAFRAGAGMFGVYLVRRSAQG